MNVKDEITLVLYGLNVGVQAVQWAAVSMPTWGHILITIGASTLAAVVNRANVTPTSKLASVPTPAHTQKVWKVP